MNPKIGLLPLYFKFYNNVMPELMLRIEEFNQNIIKELNQLKINVLAVPISCVKEDFLKAIKLFEKNQVDAIVAIHLAYSPSLESAKVLAKTKIPIIILDTTPNYEFGPDIDPDEIMYNHGIHGVQDLCNVLLREGKDFIIEAGHWKKSDVLKRVLKHIMGALISRSFRISRVGSIGGHFKGMGDVYVPSKILKDTIGIETIYSYPKDLVEYVPKSRDKIVKMEFEEDLNNFQTGGLKKEAHINTIRAGLAVRHWIISKNLTSFTINFSAFDKKSGFPTIPFLEASKAMARGIGYAGEGDILTASFVGALLKVFPQTTFAEMFCPDWKGNRIFVSHMGEANINLIAGKPRLIEKDLPFLKTNNPVMAMGRFKSGNAILVNLAPIRGGDYLLVISEIYMEDVKGKDKFTETIHGWFQPKISIPEFLMKYSRVGGTHHSAIIYNGDIEIIFSFGKIMGWNTVVI